SIKINDILTQRDIDGERRASLGLAVCFSEDLIIERNVFGYANYEALSIRYLSKNVICRSNVYRINRPSELQFTVHAAQVARPRELSDLMDFYYGDSYCNNITFDNEIFYLENNVEHAITTHTSNGTKILNCRVVDTRDYTGSSMIYKPFDKSNNVIIEGNYITINENSGEV